MNTSWEDTFFLFTLKIQWTRSLKYFSDRCRAQTVADLSASIREPKQLTELELCRTENFVVSPSGPDDDENLVPELLDNDSDDESEDKNVEEAEVQT